MHATRKVDTSNPMLRGEQYAASHKASVVAILGDQAPPVSSRGSLFYNVDRWTLRFFVKEMCEWAGKNPQCIPTRDNIEQWVENANAARVGHREIVIAGTPEKLTVRTANALTGGAYHEAWHTKYSRRRNLRIDEMFNLVIPRWAKVPDWSGYAQLILDWSNIIEDIRIERCGRQDYPGAGVKMHDLQDFILALEEAGQEAAGRMHGGKGAKRGALSLITATFRDIGLGYNTTKQREALARYKAEDAAAVEFVLGKGKGNPGPLTALLKEAIELAPADDTGSLRLALDVLGVLQNESKMPDPANDPNNQEHQPGEGYKLDCPKCGAKGSKMVVRPKSDGHGGKVRGKGILTCSVCGYQEEVDLKPQQGGGGGKVDPDHTPKFEGFDKDDQPQQGGGGGGRGDPQDGDETPQDGSGGSGKGDDKDGDQDGSGGSGKGDDKDGDQDGSGGSQDGKDEDAGDEGEGAGGHSYQEGPVQGNDWSSLVNDALKNADEGAGLHDLNSALGQEFEEQKDKELKVEGGIKTGERQYNPLDPSLDTIEEVRPSGSGKDYDRRQALALYASVKSEASYLRSRLRQIIKSLEMVGTIHGIQKGRRLSPRFLVDSKCALVGKQQPKRAFLEKDDEVDTTMAAAVVIDESGSMGGLLKDATRVMVAITEPLDSLGCPVQVSGFRDGMWGDGTYAETLPGDKGTYHRIHGIYHDVFKWFDEPFRSVNWRFANTRADGGTPMADGIQFALDGLAARPETHRVMFVVTDGCPNKGHRPIMKRQIRLAEEAGIHVIGVGLGPSAQYVQDAFPDSVWTDTIPEMPKALIAKLNDLVDTRVSTGKNRKPKK